MFCADTKLPHLLPPKAYWEPDQFEAELRSIIRSAWHVVGTTAELMNHGDFITTEIAGEPIQVRNFQGKLSALSNVCAHRHSLLTSKCSGNSPTMRCQYHGWEYQESGQTGKIPEPKNFVPFDRESLCLKKFPLAIVGQLVFVSVDSHCQSVEQFLGPNVFPLVQNQFGEQWKLGLNWNPQLPVNWKIPVENSLEAYHVPAVHPQTFRVDPGAERSEHRLGDHDTSFYTALPFDAHSRFDATFQKLEGRFVRWLGYSETQVYHQLHVFPNLLFSFTDAVSLVNCIMPDGPMSSRAIVRQFGRTTVNGSWLKKMVARIWNRLKSAITKKILLEDVGIYSAIQQGMLGSKHAGVLGKCEERIHRFQAYVAAATS